MPKHCSHDLHFCGTCKIKFETIDQFVTHKRLCVNISSKQSQTPTKKATKLSNLSMETNQTSQSNSVINIPTVVESNLMSMKQNASFICGWEQNCQYTTRHKKDFIRHQRQHTGEKPFKCIECSKSFGRKDKLLLHSRTHFGEKKYKCTQCSYAASEVSNLKKHIRVHNDERPLKCQLCEYRCRDSSHLAVHTRSHTGDAPFTCDRDGCESSFKTNSDLKRHTSRVHKIDKEFICKMCFFKCYSRVDLHQHMLQNHPKQRTKCQNKTSQVSHKSKCLSKKKNGLKVNLSTKNFFCKDCDASFICQNSLKIHEACHQRMQTNENNVEGIRREIAPTQDKNLQHPSVNANILTPSNELPQASNISHISREHLNTGGDSIVDCFEESLRTLIHEIGFP